jgi:hypothetical protein
VKYPNHIDLTASIAVIRGNLRQPYRRMTLRKGRALHALLFHFASHSSR